MPTTLFPMKELDVHNDLLGDPVRLNQVFADQGYLYFREVLDKDAIEEVRRTFFSVLVNDYGVVDPGQEQPIWNGKDVTDFPAKVPEIYGSGTYERFVSNPKIHGFFESIMGEPISWIPSTEYRLNPPIPEDPEDYTAGRHQDGFYNNGYTFRICWIPLADIPESVGGLALAPGAHKRGFLHDVDDGPKFPIPPGAIADHEWARPKVYKPGDVVVFSDMTPHCGLPNRGEAFRLSMDIRFSRLTDPQPVIGELTSVSTESITLDTSVGPVTLLVDDDTYLRLADGLKQDIAKIESLLKIGDPLLVGRSGDRAVLIRPQKG